MAEVNLPNNSHAVKEEKAAKEKTRTKIEPVVSVPGKTRKKGMGSKIRENFVGDDAQSVGEYVVMDVLIPAAKRAISEAVSQGIERLLFGEVRRNSGGSRSYTTYSSPSVRRYAEPPRSSTRPDMNYRARATHDFSDILLENRVDAEQVIDSLGNLVDQYNYASVADLYDLVGITSNYTDQKWGWDDIRGAEVRRVRDGYALILPKPIAL